ncbi:MAG: hypothetical protein KA388_02505 [Rhodocyclaceae bacterium]|nr:hypothetical protein [Rhodocyclaceae bacterium]MBL0074642.1 hypothetical protein [Rhodocyclaceae bacterium]MBP6109475.1 hypothetical protein [Rhodocyclaceae bacterium]MBP6278611.1 hypothetical protein [Rhodocyclaceae bacterium]
MLILRIVALLAAFGIAVGVLSWVFTRDRRYLQISWRIGQAALAIALLLMVLMMGERLLLSI